MNLIIHKYIKKPLRQLIGMALLFFIHFNISAQSSKVEYRFNDLRNFNKTEAASRDTVKHPFFYYMVKHKQIEYYPNGNIYRIYYVRRRLVWKLFYHPRPNPSYNNHSRRFYLIKKMEIFSFKNTMLIYYPNGNKYKELSRFEKGRPNGGFPNIAYRVINAWDTIGVRTLVNGNGFYTEYDGDSKAEKRYANYQLVDTSKFYTNNKLTGFRVYVGDTTKYYNCITSKFNTVYTYNQLTSLVVCRNGKIIYTESNTNGKIIYKKKLLSNTYTTSQRKKPFHCQLQKDYAMLFYKYSRY